MPNALVTSFAKRSKKSVDAVEAVWKETEDALIKDGHKKDDENFYPILTSIVKKKLHITSPLKEAYFYEY